MQYNILAIWLLLLFTCCHVQLLQPRGRYVTRQAPLGFSRQEHRSGLPFPSPGDLPNTGIESAFPALAGRFFTAETARKSRLYGEDLIKQKCFILFQHVL